MDFNFQDYDVALKRLKTAGAKILKEKGEDITVSAYGLPADTSSSLPLE